LLVWTGFKWDSSMDHGWSRSFCTLLVSIYEHIKLRTCNISVVPLWGMWYLRKGTFVSIISTTCTLHMQWCAGSPQMWMRWLCQIYKIFTKPIRSIQLCECGVSNYVILSFFKCQTCLPFFNTRVAQNFQYSSWEPNLYLGDVGARDLGSS
jgi:hypothetical protein